MGTDDDDAGRPQQGYTINSHFEPDDSGEVRYQWSPTNKKQLIMLTPPCILDQLRV